MMHLVMMYDKGSEYINLVIMRQERISEGEKSIWLLKEFLLARKKTNLYC